MFRAAFSRAQELAPSLVPAHFVLVNVLSKRWGGSHETSLEWARKAVQAAPTGTDMPVCLFWAHDLVRTHLDRFDSAPAAAEAYARRPEVRAELEEAFDRWTLSHMSRAAPVLLTCTVPRRGSIECLTASACSAP